MKKDKPTFDVVITCAGRFDMLTLCLDAIYNTATFPISITIVDDACKKEEKMQFSSIFAYNEEKDIYKTITSFRCLRNETQQGFVKSCNRGAKGSKAPYLSIITDDVIIHEGYFDKMFECMKDADMGIVGSKLIFPPTSTHKARPAGKIQHVGVALDIRANVVHPLVGWSPENPKTQISREVLAVTGAIMTIRSKIFHSLGGFDVIYGLGYWEDIDLCLKVRKLGYKIWLENSASAYHYVAATSEKGVVHNSGFQQNAMIFRTRWANSGFLVFDSFTYG
jgi:GT2 family glycosyltransferase